MKRLGLFITAGLAGLFAFVLLTSAQTTSQDARKLAADAWMLTPTPYLDWNKDISSSLRAERDRFWDKASMSPVPLTQADSSRVVGGSIDLTADPFEIAHGPNRAVLTATFTGHRSVLSASEYSLYSEVTMHVDKVFEDRTGSGHPIADHVITLVLYGGTVVLRNGQILSVDNPEANPEFFIQPGHRYLLVLEYHSEGDFYGYGDSWDMTNGKLRANSPRSLYFAQEGHSSLNGIDAQQLGPALAKVLYGH